MNLVVAKKHTTRLMKMVMFIVKFQWLGLTRKKLQMTILFHLFTLLLENLVLFQKEVGEILRLL